MESSVDFEKDKEVLQNLSSLIHSGNLSRVKEFMETENPSRDLFKEVRKTYLRRTESRLEDYQPVCEAAKSGHVGIMDFLISAGFDYEGEESCGYWRPIHYAAVYGGQDVLESLVVKHKVDVNDVNNYGGTALVLAIEYGDLEMVKLLVESGAYVNFRLPMDSNTALHIAADHKPEICEYLISVGADVNAVNYSCTTPLIAAAFASSIKTAKLLLDNGADVNFSNDYSATPFIAGVGERNLDLLKLFCFRGGDPEHQNDRENTPLHLSVSRHLYAITRYLAIDVGVLLDKKNSDGDTPFNIAMMNGDKPTAQLLISAGYDPGKDVCIYDDNRFDQIFGDDDGKEFVKSVRQVAINPRCLQDVCCFRIRRLLGRDVPNLVDFLPLPQGLKDILMLRHV